MVHGNGIDYRHIYRYTGYRYRCIFTNIKKFPSVGKGWEHFACWSGYWWWIY